MSNITCTISNVSYPVHLSSGFNLASVLEARDILTLTIIDNAGTLVLQRGQPVVFSDTISGSMYTGYVQSDRPQKQSPDPTNTVILHNVSFMDPEYKIDKRSNETNYASWNAGDVFVDMVQNGALASEGVQVAAALRHETTTTDFNQGINSGTVGSTAITTNDGDLELAPSGVNLTYSENTTTQFATGTLTGVQAYNNTLMPIPGSAIKIVSTLNSGQTSGTITSVKIWSGSVVINNVPNSTFANYDIFIDPSSPQATASLNWIFSDGSNAATLATILNGSVDGQFILPAATNDLTGLATIGWYAHGFNIGTPFHGKTLVAVTFDIAGTSPGTYTAYVRNVNLTNQDTSLYATIFSSSLNVNPPQQLQNYGYVNTAVSVVPAYNLYNFPVGAVYGAKSYKVTSAFSVGSVKLLRTSNISWTALEPTNTKLVVKYSLDGNAFVACTNNAPLPGLPPGLDLTGKSIYFQYQFYALQGANPELTPVLESLQLNLYTSYQATKADVTYAADTQALWNAGTLTNLAANGNGQLVLNGIIRNWDDGNFGNQPLYATGSQQESPNNRAFTIWNMSAGTSEARSRLDFAGQWQNFTAEVDVKLDPADPVQHGFVYRTTNWQNNAGSAAYYAWVTTTFFALGKGTNSLSSPSAGQTVLGSAFISSTAGSWHRLKVVVSGSSYKAYLDDVLLVSVTDSTYSAAGYLGLYATDGGSGAGSNYTTYFDNFGIVPALSGTWVSGSQSLASVGTYGNSITTWRDDSVSYNGQSNTSILVQVSYDGGTTYAPCTNGSPLPGLTAGQNLAGVNAQFRITLSTTTAESLPAISNFVVRVLGSYSSSGTRTTLPLGMDTATRANVGSGFGTSTDGQTYTQTGTGTTNLTSNELQIVNTTGDVFMQLGSRTGNDMDETVHFLLSASTIVSGMALRYQDANNYYRFSASTTSYTLLKKSSGMSFTLASGVAALSPNTFYNMRFRVAGGTSGPVSLFGKVWAIGTLEPVAWTLTATD